MALGLIWLASLAAALGIGVIGWTADIAGARKLGEALAQIGTVLALAVVAFGLLALAFVLIGAVI